MLLAPADMAFDLRRPPRLSLGLAALLLLLGFWLTPSDRARQLELSVLYPAELLAIEWPLYRPHLMQSGQSVLIKPLETANARGDTDVLVNQLGYDRDFVESLRTGGETYLDPETFSRWQKARQDFDAERNRLSSQVIGLDPQRFRPITFISHAFTDGNLYNVLSSVVLLLLIGMAVEWMLGSGALLSAWLAGSIIGGAVYWLTHSASLLPLTGSAHATTGVLGLAFWQFRRKDSLRVLDSHLTLGGGIPAILILGCIGLQVTWHDFDWRWMVSLGGSALAGIGIALAHQRWYSKPETEETYSAPMPEENSANETYRQDLNQVMQKLSQMQFVAAEKNIRALLEKYPQDKRLLEQLYHLAKLQPLNLEFEEIAFVLLTLPNQPSSNHVSLRIYRDYIQRSQTFVALDDNTCLQLVLRFTRIDALKDAEEIFKRALESNRQAPLLAKAAHALSIACAARHMEQRAAYYAGLAKTSS